MSLISSPFSITTAAAGTSPLAVHAAGMSANTWSFSFVIPGLNLACGSGGGSSTTLVSFAARCAWDSTRKTANFYGQGHAGGVPDIPDIAGYFFWTDATNSFYRELYPSSALDSAHAYNHLTVNPTTGYLYQRITTNTTDEIRRRNPSSTGGLSAWQAGFVTNITPSHASGEVYNAIEWFPELNGGAGGLVYAGVFGAKWSNAALTSWQFSPTLLGSNIHTWIARAGGFVYWGRSATRQMWRMSPTATFTEMPATPGPTFAGVNSGVDQSIVLPHPNGTDLLLFECFNGGAIYRFNGTSWSSAGTHQLGDLLWVGFTVHEYGVIVFLKHANNGQGASTTIIYKPPV